MNPKNIIESTMKELKYSKEQIVLVKALQQAKDEWQMANEFFEQVSNPQLIDYAIYREHAAKSRYTYLLQEAKRKNIKGSTNLSIEKLNAV